MGVLKNNIKLCLLGYVALTNVNNVSAVSHVTFTYSLYVYYSCCHLLLVITRTVWILLISELNVVFFKFWFVSENLNTRLHIFKWNYFYKNVCTNFSFAQSIVKCLESPLVRSCPVEVVDTLANALHRFLPPACISAKLNTGVKLRELDKQIIEDKLQ